MQNYLRQQLQWIGPGVVVLSLAIVIGAISWGFFAKKKASAQSPVCARLVQPAEERCPKCKVVYIYCYANPGAEVSLFLGPDASGHEEVIGLEYNYGDKGIKFSRVGKNFFVSQFGGSTTPRMNQDELKYIFDRASASCFGAGVDHGKATRDLFADGRDNLDHWPAGWLTPANPHIPADPFGTVRPTKNISRVYGGRCGFSLFLI